MLKTKHLISIVILTMSYILSAQSVEEIRNYSTNDVLYANQVSGLKFHQSMNNESLTYDSIQFGDSVILINIHFGEANLGNRKGNWLEVSHQNKIGFVSSCFVSKIRIKHAAKIECYGFSIFESINKKFRQESVSNNIEYSFGGITRTEKSMSEEKIYQSTEGNTIRSFTGYEVVTCIVDSYYFTMNDIINILEYKMAKMNCHHLSKELKPKDIVISYRNNSTFIEKIEFNSYPLRINCVQIGERIILSYACE